MKNTTLTKKINSILIAGFTALMLLALSGTASAIGEGQIEGGDIYRLKNVTKNTSFSDPASADKCETVQYKIRFHNGGPGIVSNVNVKATLPANVSSQNVSTATITAQNAQPATVTDTATLNLSTPQKVEYISGSTQLLDTHSNVLSGLPDGITGNGINIGSVGVSLNEIKFVQFKAKIDCPKPPCEHDCNPCVDNPKTPANECKPETPEKPKTPEIPAAPGKLPETGPGAVIAGFIGVSSVSGVAYHFIRRRLGL